MLTRDGSPSEPCNHAGRNLHRIKSASLGNPMGKAHVDLRGGLGGPLEATVPATARLVTSRCRETSQTSNLTAQPVSPAEIDQYFMGLRTALEVEGSTHLPGEAS